MHRLKISDMAGSCCPHCGSEFKYVRGQSANDYVSVPIMCEDCCALLVVVTDGNMSCIRGLSTREWRLLREEAPETYEMAMDMVRAKYGRIPDTPGVEEVMLKRGGL
jgi:hypothetical protein